MDKYVEKGRFNSKKWIADNTIPVNEKLSIASAKRMDGLHNLKAMKQVIVGAKTIQKDLYDEGFENDEILEFLMDRIRKAAF